MRVQPSGERRNFFTWPISRQTPRIRWVRWSQLGLQATWTTDYSALQGLDRAAAQPELARLNMGFPAGQWLDIEILDYLTTASVIINGESRLDVDLLELRASW